MIHRLAISIMLAALVAAAPAAGDVVERRGGAPSLIGDVISLDDGGVRLREPSGLMRTVPWDRVRSIQATRPDPRLAERLGMAADLWRARSRLERHDAALAEPLFERWFDQYIGQTNETALVVAEGLLRCRLARGANEGAVIPALEVARLRRAGQETDSYSLLPPALDTATSVCTRLPPVWAQPRAMARLERDLNRYEAGEDEIVAALAALYRRALLRQLGRAEPPRAAPWPDHPGVQLLARYEAAADPEAPARDRARARLLERDEVEPEWIDAWDHLFAGLSMLEERDELRRQRGLVALAHVTARFGTSHPYLAGLALDRMAAALEAAGELDAATQLRAELARRYPRHPVRQQDQITRAGRPAPGPRETT